MRQEVSEPISYVGYPTNFFKIFSALGVDNRFDEAACTSQEQCPTKSSFELPQQAQVHLGTEGQVERSTVYIGSGRC